MDLVDTIITVHQRRNNRMKWYYYERSQNKQPSVALSHTCRLKPFSDYCEINQGLFTVLYSHLTSHPHPLTKIITAAKYCITYILHNTSMFFSVSFLLLHRSINQSIHTLVFTTICSNIG